MPVSGAARAGRSHAPAREAERGPDDGPVDPARRRAAEDFRGYWSADVRIIIGRLIVWAPVSFRFAILLRAQSSGIGVRRTDLGFRVARRGPILVFPALIFFHA